MKGKMFHRKVELQMGRRGFVLSGANNLPDKVVLSFEERVELANLRKEKAERAKQKALPETEEKNNE